MNLFSRSYFNFNKHSNYIFDYHHLDNDRYWQSILHLINKHQIKGHMIDIGCAYGFLLKRLARCSDSVHGIDISEHAIAQSRQSVPSACLRVLDLDSEDLPYPSHYFHLITALDVLEHTKSVIRSLEKLVDKLSTNGYLLISVPVKDTWAGKIWTRYLDKDPTHISIPTTQDMFRMLKELNLKILERRYFYNLTFCKLYHVPVNIELLVTPNM